MTSDPREWRRRFIVFTPVITFFALTCIYSLLRSPGFIDVIQSRYRGSLNDQNNIIGDRVMLADRSVADELASKVRVLCWVMTQPDNHEKKARHVKATWGKRCNVLLFMSTVEDKSLPSIKLPVHEGRNYLWAKTKAAFRYVYEHHRRDADWFMKADDDTYVIVENLRYMLADYDSNSPIYFGCRFKPFTNQGFMSGGAGYVLSKRALGMFVRTGLSSPTLCKASTDDDLGVEDVEMGKCLDNIGVKAMDSRDPFQRGRFLPFEPKDHMFPDKIRPWYWKFIFYATRQGLDCCSDYAIAFHYITPEYMYVLEYFIYHLRTFGINYRHDELPKIQRNQSEDNKSKTVAAPYFKPISGGRNLTGLEAMSVTVTSTISSK